MTQEMTRHEEFTTIRVEAYDKLFGHKATEVFSFHRLKAADTVCLTDVLVYPLEVEGVEGPVVAAVTNGMSDFPMYHPEEPDVPLRRELIQYFRVCTEHYAGRLHACAWLPDYDGFALDLDDTISWPDKLVDELQHSLFLQSINRRHAEFRVEIDSDEMSLLWHIPITGEELEYKKSRGMVALINRMEIVGLPWIFDPETRPPLLKPKKRR
jgi:hypothetical protein